MIFVRVIAYQELGKIHVHAGLRLPLHDRERHGIFDDLGVVGILLSAKRMK